MASPERESPDLPDPAGPMGQLPDDLLAIRERLKRARKERGACPPWNELRADLLPGGATRPGRAERMAHFEICPYCDAHVGEWKKSFDHTSDTLGAIERGVARGIVQGARGIAGRIVSSARKDGAARSSDPDPVPDVVDVPASPVWDAPPPPPPPAPPSYSPPPPPAPPSYSPPPSAHAEPPSLVARETPRPEPRQVPEFVREDESEDRAPLPVSRAMPVPTGGILVVECVPSRVPPDAVFLCAAALGLEVACVDRIEELDGDPDASAVRGVIIASDRTPADWPQAVRTARRLAPGRPVLVLAMFGQEPPKGARRALGEALLPASATAEELLVSLDPRLR